MNIFLNFDFIIPVAKVEWEIFILVNFFFFFFLEFSLLLFFQKYLPHGRFECLYNYKIFYDTKEIGY